VQSYRYGTLSGIGGFSMVGSALSLSSFFWSLLAIGVTVAKVPQAAGGVSLSILCCDSLLQCQEGLRLVLVTCVCRSCDPRCTCG